MHILAIEDHHSFLDLMRSNLVKRGFTVDTAGTLADGLVLACACRHDVILLDLSLPDGDGTEIIKALHREPIPTPVIVLSGRGEIIDRVGLLETGADDYL